MYQPKNNRQRLGAIIMYGAFGLFVMLIVCAVSIDVAYMQLVRTELRTAADAASNAGCEALSREQSRDAAITAAKAAAAANFVARAPLLLDDADIELGTSAQNGIGRFVFTPEAPGSTALVNSVRVDGRRDGGSASGRVKLFMGGILDTEFFAPRQQAVSATSVRDISIILDRSGSMAGTKIEELKSAVDTFFGILGGLPGGAVQGSLVSYATEPTLDSALTSDFVFLNSQVQALNADGLTNIGDSLRAGVDSLLPPAVNTRPFAEKAVVLLTDGNNTTGNDPFRVPPGQARNAVRVCVDNGIPVFTIAFGDDADETLMRQIAADTGGFFRDANNGADLEEAFREIAAQLAVLLVQ